MNLNHLEVTHYTQKLAWLLSDANHDYTSTEVILLVPFTDLRSVQILINADKLPIQYGAQDISTHRGGSYTGEISASQLKSLGVSYTLAGHTERRKYFAETDEIMMKKGTRALEEGIKPILCIGEENEEPLETPDFEFLFKQLEPIIQKINSVGKSEVIPFLEKAMIAYEPRWAVNNGHTCSPEYLELVMTGIRKKIIAEIGEEYAYKIQLLYGGSVNLNTVASIISSTEVDGVLIGKASLDPDEFAKIIRVINKTIDNQLNTPKTGG